MSIDTLADKTGSYFVSQLQERPQDAAPAHTYSLHPSLTVSHQTGAGVAEISAKLAQLLGKMEFHSRHHWTVYDQKLIEVALEAQNWPKELAEKVTEEKRFFIDELVEDLLGLRPPSWVLIPQMMETTLRLALAGHSILVGHGATVVTAHLPNVFHVRLTGTLAKRIERVQRTQNLPLEAATKFVRKEDRKRAKFLKAHFHTGMDNELLYDLVINTDRLPDYDVATVIADTAAKFFSTANAWVIDRRKIARRYEGF